MNSSMTQGRTFAKGVERGENYVITEKRKSIIMIGEQ